ncbi:CehA/McbA family metallohydrolase [soil metagenome]
MRRVRVPRRKLFVVIAAWIGLIFAAQAVAQTGVRAPDLVVVGTMTGADHETYREVPFKVPAGVARMTVEFDYTGKAERSVIDLGIRDPQRFRGWSGGNKKSFVIEEADATPSYLPGPLPPGVWKLVLGVPNIRKTSSADFTARIWFDRADAPFRGFSTAPIKAGLAWYRGDLHMHTGHSDGACQSRLGKRVPCPVFRTLQAAASRGLDFIAVTDHNATSQNASLRELAPFFDDLLLIPGREITTFQGHANVFGVTGPLDFQLTSPRAPSLTRILDQVDAARGLFSVNHPGQPTGEACMGCGWTAKTDWSRVPAIEAINGATLSALGPEGRASGIAFWEARLNTGYRITAIGGSDNHDASNTGDKATVVGRPATVVHASELSQAAILSAIRQGHVFVDVWGSPDRLLEVQASAGGQRAEMGDVLRVGAGASVVVDVHVAGLPKGARLSLAGDSPRPADLTDPGVTGEARRRFTITADGGAHWLRVDVRGSDGVLLLLGNPIYLRPVR